MLLQTALAKAQQLPTTIKTAKDNPPLKRQRTSCRSKDPFINRTNIQIRASSIPGSGGGVFYSGSDVIKRGTLLGYYGGAHVKEEPGQTHDYEIEGKPGRNPIDPQGRLIMNDDTEQDSNTWTSQEWQDKTNSETYGIWWESGESIAKVPANWTRFMNTSSGVFLNVNMVTAGTQAAEKYKAYAFVSCQKIYPGDELFWSYGSNWLRSRDITPLDPDASKARPNWHLWPYSYKNDPEDDCEESTNS